MNLTIENTDLSTLLTMYNQEIDTLKAKMLNGASWESLTPHRRQITLLAVAIHNSCPRIEAPSGVLAEYKGASNFSL